MSSRDLISELPDEIIHDILELLQSPNQSAKSSLLSTRWLQIWRSYPNLEFHGYDLDDRYDSSAKLQSFVAAAWRRFRSSQPNSIKSVRISAKCSDFIAAMLDLIANIEPEEIVLECGTFQFLATQLVNNNKLKVLCLHSCKFWEFKAADKMDMMVINLRVLYLGEFSIEEQFLNDLIAAAPLLEELFLWYPKTTITRLQICNNPNLKVLVFKGLSMLNDLDISPSALSSVKSITIISARELTEDVVNDLISNSLSLELLRLGCIPKVKELKIRSDTLQQLQLNSQMKLYIDAPRLVNVHYGGYMHCLLATHPTNLQEAQPCTFTLQLDIHGQITMDHFIQLKSFLLKLKQQYQFVHLLFHINWIPEGVFDLDQVVDDDSPIPMIEHVEFKFDHSGIDGKGCLMEGLFRSCRPKYLCLIHCRESYQSVAKFFVNKTSVNYCKRGCKCWRHQLKDLKIVNKKEDDDDDEELLKIPDCLNLPCTKDTRVWFELIWC